MTQESHGQLDVPSAKSAETVAADDIGAKPTLDGWMANLFAIDVRSLAAMRIGIGAVLLADVCWRGTDLVAHYCDAGVLPRAARIALTERGVWTAPPYWLSAHMLSGSAWWQFFLFATAAVFAVWVLIGYRTRLALAASWYLVVSVHARNPLLLQGGDDLLRCLLLWCLFLPLGARWSVDQALRPVDVPRRILSVASVALLLQLCLMYWFTAVLKTDDVWRRDFSALYYALRIDHFTTPLGIWLAHFPQFLKVLTLGTWLLEWAGPFLLFSPVLTGRFRTIIVAAFIALHLGIAMTLEIGLFSYICIVYWIAFLPSGFWDYLGRLRLAREMKSKIASPLLASFRWTARRWPHMRGESAYFQLSLPASGLVFALFTYVLFLNMCRADGNVYANLKPGPLRWLGESAQLGQYWGMFAPRPHLFGGWLVMKGTLDDGTEVNLFHPEQGLARPEVISAMYPNQRWRKCLMNLFERDCPLHCECVSHYLQRRWNETHGPDKRVAVVELVNMMTITPRPGMPRANEPSVEPVTLLRWDYRLHSPERTLAALH